MSMQFKCPKCGDKRLFEMMKDVTVESVCSWDESLGNLVYGEQTNGAGEIVLYECDNGHVLRNPDGTLVRDDEEIEAWLKTHQKET